MGKGASYPAEWRSYRDPETGHRVVQLTQGRHVNGGCYVSHHAVTADDREVVFCSDRTGCWELFRADLQTGSLQQLTETGVAVRPEDRFGSSCKHFDVCAATGTVYYMAGRELHRLRLDTLADEVLLEIPPGTTPDYPHVNRDGTWLALGYADLPPTARLRTDATEGRLDHVLELRYRHPRSTLIALDLRTGKSHGVWGETEWLDHVQIHPSEPLLLFCHEAWPAHRAMLAPIDHSFTKQPRLLLPHQKPGIELTGHELFCVSGEALFMLVERSRPQAPTEAERIASEVGYIAFIQPDGEGFVRYRPPYQVPGHVVARSSREAIVGNAAFLAADDPDGHARIGRFEPRGGGGFDLLCTPLCRHDRTLAHFAGEPHPILTADGRRVLFSSAMGQADGVHLFMTDVYP